MHEDDLQVMEEGKEVVDREHKITLSDGERRWLSTIKVPRYGDEGNIIGMVGISRDVTERKKAEEKLNRYKRAVEGSKDLIAGVDGDYNYTFVNEAFLDYHQLNREEVVGHSVREVGGEEVFEEAIKPRVDKCLEGETVRYEMEHQFPDSEKVHLNIIYYPVREGGKISGVVADMRDVTEQEEARRELESVLRSSGDSIYMVDEDCRYVLANEELASRLGKESKKEVIGKKFHELHPPERSKEFEKLVRKVYDTGERVKQEHKREDLERWFLRTLSPMKDPETGRVRTVVVVSKDITERKELERELRESEERFRSIVNHTNDAIVTADREGRVTYWNEGAENAQAGSQTSLILLPFFRM